MVVIGVGLGVGGYSLSISKVTFCTPGIFGTNPDVFKGPAYYMAGSFTIGPRGVGVGYGLSRIRLGMGKSDNISHAVVFGYDTGIEVLVGYSILLR